MKTLLILGGAALGLFLLTRKASAKTAPAPQPGDLVQITPKKPPGEMVQITPKTDADLPAFTMEDLEGTGRYGRF